MKNAMFSYDTFTHRILSFAEHDRPGESRESRSNVDGTRASTDIRYVLVGNVQIVDSELVEPSVGIPFPISKEAVDECSPAEDEQHTWEQATSFEHCTRQNHSGGCDESEMEGSEEYIGNGSVG
jgi:hypothetical protein